MQNTELSAYLRPITTGPFEDLEGPYEPPSKEGVAYAGEAVQRILAVYPDAVVEVEPDVEGGVEVCVVDDHCLHFLTRFNSGFTSLHTTGDLVENLSSLTPGLDLIECLISRIGRFPLR